MGTNRDFNYMQALLHGPPASSDPDGMGFQHPILDSQAKTAGQKQSCSDVSMRINLPDEHTPSSLSREITFQGDDTSAEPLNLGALQIEQRTSGVNSCRKRPAEHDAKPPRITPRSGTGSKLACTSTGNFDASAPRHRISDQSLNILNPQAYVNSQSVRDPPREAQSRGDPPPSTQPERDRAKKRASTGDISSPISQDLKSPHRSPLNQKTQKSHQQARFPETISRRRRGEFNDRGSHSTMSAFPHICETANETVQRNRQLVLQSLRSRGELEDNQFLDEPVNLGLIGQPHSRPIPQDLLEQEVDGIHHVVCQVEAKCNAKVREEAEAIRKRKDNDEPQPELDNRYWQSMVGIHRVLLHEFHDFFLSSHHPTARADIRGKSATEAMPARMWKFGIHDFLELLRSLLPQSLEYMVSFLLLAYQMIALLYETVPNLEDVWMECLGDLSRYRMAIEELDREVRDNWTEMSRYWYNKVLDSTPQCGRLLHHIAILCRHFPAQQLSFYCASLIASQPFVKTRDSVEHLFRPIIERDPALPRSVDEQFICLHAFMLHQNLGEDFTACISGFMGGFERRFRVTRGAQDTLMYMAISNIAGLMEYEALITGDFTATDNVSIDDSSPQGPCFSPLSITAVAHAQHLTFGMLSFLLQRKLDTAVVPHVHLVMIFIWRLASLSALTDRQLKVQKTSILQNVPLKDLCAFLNFHLQQRSLSQARDSYCATSPYPSRILASGEICILPEDRLQRGQSWSVGYLPDNWYPDSFGRLDSSGAHDTYPHASGSTQKPHFNPRTSFDLMFYDDYGRIKETAYTPTLRMLRIIHLAKRIASLQPFIQHAGAPEEKPRQWLYFNPSLSLFELRYSQQHHHETVRHLNLMGGNVHIKKEDADTPMSGVIDSPPLDAENAAKSEDKNLDTKMENKT